MAGSGIILIADDDENDVLLFQRSLKAIGVRNRTVAVMSGLEVMDYLAGRNHYSNRTLFPLPLLTFLDAKMPIYDCFHVLRWIRQQDETLRAIPIVVISGSISPADQKKVLELGAKAFYSKPLERAQLKECIDLYLTGSESPQR